MKIKLLGRRFSLSPLLYVRDEEGVMQKVVLKTVRGSIRDLAEVVSQAFESPTDLVIAIKVPSILDFIGAYIGRMLKSRLTVPASFKTFAANATLTSILEDTSDKDAVLVIAPKISKT